jgi:hypothetical protein
MRPGYPLMGIASIRSISLRYASASIVLANTILCLFPEWSGYVIVISDIEIPLHYCILTKASLGYRYRPLFFYTSFTLA